VQNTIVLAFFYNANKNKHGERQRNSYCLGRAFEQVFWNLLGPLVNAKILANFFETTNANF
jgi:hypothetical protein